MNEHLDVREYSSILAYKKDYMNTRITQENLQNLINQGFRTEELSFNK